MALLTQNTKSDATTTYFKSCDSVKPKNEPLCSYLASGA